MSKKTDRFSYKGGCGICECMCIEAEELAWAVDKQLRVISNKMLFKAVVRTTKKLKKKAVLNLKQYCMHYYVTLSNVF